jgi:hypothetical protein
MNLTVSHGCFSGSPDMFNVLCTALADVSGIQPYIGSDAESLGEWDEAPEDPLLILVIHDEHQGRICTRHCSVLADRLDELTGRLFHRHQTLLQTQQFAQGLRYAAQQDSDVTFEVA